MDTNTPKEKFDPELFAKALASNGAAVAAAESGTWTRELDTGVKTPAPVLTPKHNCFVVLQLFSELAKIQAASESLDYELRVFAFPIGGEHISVPVTDGINVDTSELSDVMLALLAKRAKEIQHQLKGYGVEVDAIEFTGLPEFRE